MKNIFSLDDLKVGQVWMTVRGKIAIIECLHGGYTDYPFQVRFASTNSLVAVDFDVLEYLIA